jgi:three-Cys-motif partner protein
MVENMQLSQGRVHLIFIESVCARYEHLVNELASRFGPLDQLPVSVDVRHGDAGEQTMRALNEHRSWGNPILAIFDSWGNVGVPFPLVSAIANNRSSEVITTFGPNWFSRRQGINTDLLDEVFGGRDQWEPANWETDPDQRWRVWLETYRETLGRAGFGYRLHFSVVPCTGQPLYLVYGTGHPAGLRVMKDAMWNVDTDDGMRFADPRAREGQVPGQTSIWNLPGGLFISGEEE